MPSINSFVAAMAVGRIPVRSVLPGALYVYSIVDALASLGRKPSLSAAHTHEGGVQCHRVHVVTLLT